MEPIKILDRIAGQYRGILGENLVGLYAHGSLAFGCFNPAKSDIDFIVVVREAPGAAQKQELLRLLLELTPLVPTKGLEMSVVLEEHCRRFAYPTPFTLHFSNAHLRACREDLAAYCERMQGTDRDLAAHFTVIRHVGIPVYGPPVAEVFGEVPAAAYLDSLRYDAEYALEDIRGNPMYVALNLCRVLAFIREGLVLSKAQGGAWGLSHLDGRFSGLLREALACYASDREFAAEEPLLDEFCRAAMAEIFP